MNTSQLNFNITNLTAGVGTPTQGIAFVEGITKRGPVSDPSQVITSFAQFQKLFGGLIDNSDFPLLCKRALEGGASLRVNRVAHYTDITDAGTLTALVPGAITAVDGGPDDIFDVVPKYPGADYNNLSVEIKAASNGDSDYFNLEIKHSEEPDLNEIYPNILIEGTPNVADSVYLNDVINASKLVNFTYKDLSGLTAPVRPVNATYNFTGGSDGDPVVDTDYVGDASAKTGFNSFDPYDDSYHVCAPEISANNVHIGGSAYAASRKDLLYLAHLDNSLTTSAALIAARDATNIDSNKTMFFCGGLTVLDPVTSQNKDISELGDLLGIIATSDVENGEWFSPVGPQRGRVNGAIDVVNNFGSPAGLADMNALANKGINKVILKNNSIMFWDFLTAQLKNDQEQFGNVERLLLFLQKSLRPTLENYIEEPNDIITFKAMYLNVEPFLTGLVTNRALYEYSWQGDQDASSINDLQVNDLTDIQNGKYQVNFFIKPIPAMREINVNIIITPAGVSFNTAGQLV